MKTGMFVGIAAVAVLLLQQAHAQQEEDFRHARVSGDPHWTMFTGCKHDCQSTGTHMEWTDDLHWEILGNHRRCNPNARWAVMCIRSVAARMKNRGSDDWAYVKWGSFGRSNGYREAANRWTGVVEPAEPPRPSVMDRVLMCPETAFAPVTGVASDYGGTSVTDSETGETCLSFNHRSIANVEFLAFNGQYRAEYRSGLLYVQDQEGLVRFGWRGYYLVGRVHRSVNGHGLMGYNDFRASENQCFLNPNTNMNIHPTSISGRRYNGVATQNWCTGVYRLNLTDPNNVIGTPADVPHDVHVMSGNNSNLTGNNDITSAELELVGEPVFTTVDEADEAAAVCAEVPSTDAGAVEDCLFDVRVMEDKSLAREVGLSNVEAANTQQGGSNPSSKEQFSSGAVAGIVIGSIVGAAALVAVGVLYVRLRHTKNELSRALVRASSSGPSTSAGSTSQLRLGDNL